MTSRLYRNVPDSQEEVVAALTRRYAEQRIRFDTGFVGSVPVQASGRIGRRFFYFRFRGDTASLTVGSRSRRKDGSYFRRDRTKALRTLRRWKDDGDPLGLELFIAHRNLKRNTTLDRHPSVPVRYAVVNDVTGEPYNGFLETDEAAELFIRLMDSLQPISWRPPTAGTFRALMRGSYTMPSNHRQGIIRKLSKRTR
jgi:hypothetical protein